MSSNDRFGYERETWKSQFAPQGERVVILSDKQTDISVVIHPGGGSDMIRIDNPKGRDFKTRPFPGEVISPGFDACLASGTLEAALLRIGANVTALPHPGFCPPFHGLHTCLSSIPAFDVGKIDFEPDQITYQNCHLIQNTWTDPLVGADLKVERTTTLTTGVIHQVDKITARTSCHASIINHPNPLAEAGNRILVPHQQLKEIRDRDGDTPPEANPFVGVSEKFLGQAKKERCFFLFIEPDSNGWIPILLVDKNQKKGIGVVYKYHPDHPFIAIWYSPGGYFGLEGGNLPLGVTELCRLNMHHLYEKGDGWINEFKICLLNSVSEVIHFMASHKIDYDQLLESIKASDEDHRALGTAARIYNESHC